MGGRGRDRGTRGLALVLVLVGAAALPLERQDYPRLERDWKRVSVLSSHAFIRDSLTCPVTIVPLTWLVAMTCLSLLHTCDTGPVTMAHRSFLPP